ncbi:HEAT repeat domain-containing protein [Sesbania bispinosa]|nr:HEAT repeat domain-containing protein [Sesbania bispinosa]
MADRRCSRDGHSGERGALTVVVVVSLTGTILLSPTSGGWIIIILEADENPKDEDSRTATEILGQTQLAPLLNYVSKTTPPW